MTKPHHQSTYAFWQFCDHARCLPSAPDMHLGLIHKNFHKHPQRHELRAQWVVDRAKKFASITLHLESVIAASQREEEQNRNAAKHKITSFNI